MRINSEFGRNVGKMMGGTGLAQGINFLGALVLARLYTEADFGQLALFTSLTLMVSGLAGLRYELAVVLPPTPKQAHQVLALSLGLNVCFALGSLLLLLLFQTPLSQWLKAESLGPLLYAVPLSIFLLSSFNSLYQWQVRQKQFSYLAQVQVGQTLAGLGAQIGLAAIFPAIGLILGLLIRFATGLGLLFWRMLPQFPAVWQAAEPKAMQQQARRYRDFPLINSPHVGIDLLQNEGIIFLLAYYFSNALVGSYAFALRILKAPLGLIGKAITPVFYQRASELYRDQPQQLASLVKSIYLRLLLIGLPGFGVLFIIAPDLFALLFGENWRQAGQIARLLTPWLLLNFLANPVSQLPLVVDRQKEALLFAILGLVLKLAPLLYAGYLGTDGLTAFLYFCIGASLYQGIVVVWYYWISRVAPAA